MSDIEKKQVMDILYKYKYAFSLRDEIGTEKCFHSLRLSENLKRYCGILPYFGSTSYLYQRMPMGLNISP